MRLNRIDTMVRLAGEYAIPCSVFAYFMTGYWYFVIAAVLAAWFMLAAKVGHKAKRTKVTT